MVTALSQMALALVVAILANIVILDLARDRSKAITAAINPKIVTLLSFKNLGNSSKIYINAMPAVMALEMAGARNSPNARAWLSKNAFPC